MKYISVFFKTALAIIFVVLLIKFPQASSQGVRYGLRICAESVIPSLFPFSVLCSFLTVSGLCSVFGKYFSPIMKKLFKLPGSAAGAVIMGMCAGYPVGVRMTEELLREKSISRNDAERMCLFCLSAGPAFLIGTIGTVMLKSLEAGKILFISSCLSALTVGFLLRFTAVEEEHTVNVDVKKNLAGSLCEAVSSASAAMLSVCAWIILFSCICMTLRGLPDSVRIPLSAFLEVTNGTKAAVEAGLSLPVISAILGWSGISVHCQVWHYIEKCQVKPSRFIVSRIVSGALSAIYCKVLLDFFPIAETAMMTKSGLSVYTFSVSAPVSAAMLLTAGVYIINTSGIANDICGKVTTKKS